MDCLGVDNDVSMLNLCHNKLASYMYKVNNFAAIRFINM